MTSRYQLIIPTAIVILVIAIGVMLVYFQGRTGFEPARVDRCYGYGSFVADGGETVLTEQSADDLARTYGVAYAPGDAVPIAVCQPHEYSGLARVHADIGLLVGLPPAVDEAAIARRKAAEPGWTPEPVPDYDAIYQQRFVPVEVEAITDGCDSDWTLVLLEELGVEACLPDGWSVVAESEAYALLRSGGADIGFFDYDIVAFAAGCTNAAPISTPRGQAGLCQSRASAQYRTIYGLAPLGGHSVSVRIASDATGEEEAVALRIAVNVAEFRGQSPY